jgi:hypothetical protein
MTKPKKTSGKSEAPQNSASLDPKKKAQKKSYMVDDEDDELDLDDKEDDDDTLDLDPDKADMVIPKTFDPFDDDEDDDDF